MSYRPKPDSYPLAEVAEGNSGELELEDMTPDGGVALRSSRSFSGRRALPESVPKVIRWMRKRPLLDYETSCRKTVSARFRALIEEIEPGVHQLKPIRFVAKDGAPLADRWFWQVACQQIAVAGATPNRTAAARQLIPSSIAAKSRRRKSIDGG